MTNREALNVIADMCNALQLHPNSRQGEAMMMAINSLKNGTLPVEKKEEWIPVSERLPEEDGQYLVTYDREDEIKVNISYFDRHGFWIGNVITWMPLPEPHKAEREVSE